MNEEIKDNRKGRWAFTLGVLSLLFLYLGWTTTIFNLFGLPLVLIPAILAIIFGATVRKQHDKYGIGGIIFGILSLILLFIIPIVLMNRTYS